MNQELSQDELKEVSGGMMSNISKIKKKSSDKSSLKTSDLLKEKDEQADRLTAMPKPPAVGF